MTIYSIEPNDRTLHGAFSAARPPVLTIDPGDTVRFRTLDGDWNLAPRTSVHYAEKPAQFQPRPPGEEDGHPLCGPIAVHGAEPGMTLGIRIDRCDRAHGAAPQSAAGPTPSTNGLASPPKELICSGNSSPTP